MKYTVTVTVPPECEHDEAALREAACRELRNQHIEVPATAVFVCRKRSVDARRGRVKLHLRYEVYTEGDSPEAADGFVPAWKKADPEKRVVIVGNGPAGIFAALALLERGITPVVVERGAETPVRKRDIAGISRSGSVGADSNYCFGEGGAGTFSDGKLYSRSNKRGDIGRILRIFHWHGADGAILRDAHPHIGSDRLPAVINAMNDTVRKFGGEVHFNMRCTGFITEQDGGRLRVTGVRAVGVADAVPAEYRGAAVILAGGHSAADMYEMVAALSEGTLSLGATPGATLSDGALSPGAVPGVALSDGALSPGAASSVALSPAAGAVPGVALSDGALSPGSTPGGALSEGTLSPGATPSVALSDGTLSPGATPGVALSDGALEPKTFAVGLRVEHPRSYIDRIQYHGTAGADALPAAEYRLTAQIDGRGVYSFCMCPGGFVVPSSSAAGSIVVNGMSPSGRNSKWSNAAIVVEIRPEDIPPEFTGGGCPALAGLRFRTKIEKDAYAAAQKAGAGVAGINPQTAPAQLLTDFLEGRLSEKLPASSYTPGLVPVRLDLVLPPHITARLKKAFAEFNRNMRGFISPGALLIAPETRTSTPVRILRDPETRESPVIAGLYPAGEGSGYAGGIVSSAMDGEAAAAAVAARIWRR